MTEMTSYPPQSSLWVLNQHDLWYLNNSQHDCDSRAHTGYKIIHVKTDQTMEHWKSKNMGHLMTFTSFYISNHLEFLLVIWFSLIKTDQWNSRENDPGTLKTPYFKSTRRQHRGHRHQVPSATPSVSMSFICCIKLIKFVLLHHRVVWHPTWNSKKRVFHGLSISKQSNSCPGTNWWQIVQPSVDKDLVKVCHRGGCALTRGPLRAKARSGEEPTTSNTFVEEIWTLFLSTGIWV